MDFTTWLISVMIMYTVGEGFNCIYPRLEEDYDSKGLICQWEDDDFYYNTYPFFG